MRTSHILALSVALTAAAGTAPATGEAVNGLSLSPSNNVSMRRANISGCLLPVLCH